MTAPNPASVCVRDLAKRYGPIEALRSVSFEVSAGEIFGLLGPNGAGKTTALECLLGLRRPDSGSITIAGIDVLARPGEAKQRVGAQIQGAMLQDKVTPRRALRLFASFYRDPAGVEGLLEKFAFSAKADCPFASLSAGQRQRLFLALAFVNIPSLVVLDEPTAGLDPRSRRELHELIREMRASGKTVLLSTHDLEEARQLCDRIAILDEGRIVTVAKPAELIAGSDAPCSVVVSTAVPLTLALVTSLPGVNHVQQENEGWSLGTRDPSATIIGLAEVMGSQGNRIVDLRIQRPSLEDVFLSMTGKPWPASGKEIE